MVTFLLLLSLLLHMVAFIIIRNMNAKLQRAEQQEQQQRQTMKELEDLFSVYLIEIKEENEKLINTISASEQYDRKEIITNETSSNDIQLNESNNQQSPRASKNKNSDTFPPNSTVTNYMPPVESEQQDTVEQSKSAIIYSLYDQGYSINEIAKRLDCGKTEVELILKFHRKNS